MVRRPPLCLSSMSSLITRLAMISDRLELETAVAVDLREDLEALRQTVRRETKLLQEDLDELSL